MNEELEEQKSIDDLPAEMLEKVFLALDAKSLKNCCLVNKKWNNIIGQSSSVMEKLPLLLHKNYKKSWSDIYNATKNFERKFHTIDFNHFDVSDEYAIKTLNKFGAECRRIQSFCCYSSNEISMKSLKFPLLESAKIYSGDVKLLSEMLIVLSSSQLKHFSYEGSSGFTELMAFLSTQTKLTKLDLTIWDHKISLGCLSDIKRIQIPLKALRLKIRNTEKNAEPIVAFISRFTETLEDLTFNPTFNSKDDLVFELIFTKFNKLKSFSFDIDSAPQEISFYNKLRPSNSVKKLVVKGFCSNDKETFHRFIELLPNVESMSIEHFDYPPKSISCRSIEIIAKSWPNLTFLKFGRNFVAHDQIFNELLCNCKNIKTIEVEENAFKSKKSKAKILKRVKEHGLRLIIHKSDQLINNYQF